MWFWALVAYPILEVYLFILVCKGVGWENAVLLTVGTSLLGFFLLRIQRHWQIFGKNDFTARSIENYLFSNLGAFSLLLPGFVSDIFGVIVLIPFTRRALLSLLRLFRVDIYGKSTGPFSVLRTYSFGPQNPDEYNSRYSNDYGDVMDVESSETGFSSEDDSDDDAIDVDFTVRD